MKKQRIYAALIVFCIILSCFGTVALAETDSNSSTVEFDLESGILDSIADLLKTDFNPSWNTSLEDLQKMYEEKCLHSDDDSFSTVVSINGNWYFCICNYSKKDLSTINSVVIAPDYMSKGDLSDVKTYIDENIPTSAVNHFKNTMTFTSQEYSYYHLENGSTVCFVKESNASDNKMMIFPLIVRNEQALDTFSVMMSLQHNLLLSLEMKQLIEGLRDALPQAQEQAK